MSRSRIAVLTLGAAVAGYLLLRPSPAPADVVPEAPTMPLTAVPLVGLGRVESGRGLVTVASEVAGVAADVPVEMGDTVRAGTLLLRLADAAEREDLREAQARREVQRGRLAVSEAAVTRARVRHSLAEAAESRLKAVAATGGVTDEELEEAAGDVAVTREDLRGAEAERDALRAELAAADASVGVASARLAQRSLRAPVAARVLRVDVLPGNAVTAGSGVLELAPLGPQMVRCEFDELVAESVQVGARAEVRALGGASPIATGRVIRAAPGLSRKSLFADVAGEAEDRRVREVRLQLAPQAALPFNARVECAVAPADVAAGSP